MKNNRRAVLAIAAGATAAALGAVPSLALPVDPVFAAIDRYRDAVATFLVEHAKLTASGITGENWRPMDAAFRVAFAASYALIGTAPTTRAGLRALEKQLRDKTSVPSAPVVEYTVNIAGQPVSHVVDSWLAFEGADGTFSHWDVDWLIARRTAELAAA
jgi:hypothetical protein